MLVSHRKKFIYTKTIKTASTAVEIFFEKYCMPEGEWSFHHSTNEHISESGIIGFRGNRKEFEMQSPKFFHHMPASVIKEYLGDQIWKEYFKFCVIRNPFEKVLSYFFHFKEKNPNGESQVMAANFQKWVKERLQHDVDDRNKYLINDRICMDYFIRHENLLEDIKTVCRIIGVPFDPESIPRLKDRHRLPNTRIENYYNTETAALIVKYFAFEFEYFGYKKTS